MQVDKQKVHINPTLLFSRLLYKEKRTWPPTSTMSTHQCQHLCSKTALCVKSQLSKPHGVIEIDNECQDKTTKTPVYVKINAPENLLVSEGVSIDN